MEHTNLAGVTSVLTHGVDYSIEGIGEDNGGYINFPLEDSTYSVLAWSKENINPAIALFNNFWLLKTNK